MFVRKILCIGSNEMDKEKEEKTSEQQQIEDSMKKGKESL